MASWPPLILYSRAECCLCQGLADRLAALTPAPALTVVDVDGDPDLQARYGLQVPVLAVNRLGALQELPRVSPRLTGERLGRWLQSSLTALPPNCP
jgi:hypothetical protein